jgi:hypothetical protein
MRPFVRNDSIVRSIWGDSDTILFVLAGSATEFALNRAVDRLFYTGRLPADPLGRLVSTAGFAQDFAFADEGTARRRRDRIRATHEAVERSRGRAIPAWAHRDVPYIALSMRSWRPSVSCPCPERCLRRGTLSDWSYGES